jgi:hypothetical protein
VALTAALVDDSSSMIAGIAQAVAQSSAPVDLAQTTTLAQVSAGLTISPELKAVIAQGNAQVRNSTDLVAVAQAQRSSVVDALPSAVDWLAPRIAVLAPGVGATAVNRMTDLEILFDEPIALGAGMFVLSLADGQEIQRFGGNAPAGVRVDGQRVILDPTETLAGATNFRLTIAPDAVRDLAGNVFAGSVGHDFITEPAGGLRVPGTIGDDNLLASSMNDTLEGSAGNDTLTGGLGDDRIDGGAGLDVARFAHAAAAARVSTTSASLQVIGPQGTDTLIGVERLWFDDRKLAFDLQPNDSAGRAALALGVLLPAALQSPPIVGVVLGLMDSGLDITGLCQWLDDQGLLVALAGSTAPSAIARMAVTNVLRTEAPSPLVDLVASFMDGRMASYTPAQVLGIVAGLELNQVAVDLVGLQQTGLAFE